MSPHKLATIAAIALAALSVGLVFSELEHAVRNRLPLSDAAIIREQAAEKHLDPALIAAVIYAETKFEPRPSSAGAQGLMQILPATAYYLARLSGGSRFTAGDLATPRVNLAYGSYYLRYLLNHYDGNEMLTVAAYNGGIANVDNWVEQARAGGRELTVEAIPFGETRDYVRRVLAAQTAYRATYPYELGLR
ncbi:MAG: lytic transglycosylase domain-containing protein [Solirubrobacteraceae bacterium]|jgi:soluble lytic murein transglycosylase